MQAPQVPSVVRYHDGEGYHTAILAKEARKYAWLIRCADGTIDKLPLAEQRSMVPLMRRDKVYPLARAGKLVRQHARRRGGLSKEVRAELRRLGL